MAQIKQAVGYCVKSAIFSQGSVATRLMCGGILMTSLLHVLFTAECGDERILKIDQRFAKLEQE